MTTDEMQKFGKDNVDALLASSNAWTRSAQAIAAEIAGYSKKSAENSAATWQKLTSAKNLERAIEVQSEYVRSSCADFASSTVQIGGLYADFAKTACEQFTRVIANASPAR